MEASGRSDVISLPAASAFLGKKKFGLNGFTLVELIVVIVIVGIVALIAVPRFFSTSGFNAAGFQESAIGAIRYGQKVAQAQRTNVYVNTTANSVRLCYDLNCATPVLGPSDSAAYVVSAPSGITLTGGASFSFTSLGQPASSAASPVVLLTNTTFNVVGDSVARQIVVERETGYAHK